MAVRLESGVAPAATVSAVHRWGPLAVVLVVCLLPVGWLWRAPGPPMEEGFMLVFPELVLRGFVANRDFLHLYGPGSLWVLAGAFRIFGTSLEVERAVGLVQLLGVSFGVFALVRPWGRWLAAAGAALTAIIVVPPIGLTALAWVGAVAFGLWSINLACGALDERVERRSRRILGAGLLAGMALLYRPDLALALGLSGLVVVMTLERPGRVRYLGAAAVGVAPYLVHLAMAGPGNVVRGLVIEPVFQLRGGRSLPLPPSWGSFDGFLQRAGLLEEPPWPFPAAPSPAQLSLWLALLLLALLVLIVAGVEAARDGRRRLLVMALFAAGLLPQALQRADSTHLAWVSCVPFGLLPAALAELARSRARPQFTTLGAAALPLLVTLVVVPDFTWRSYAHAVTRSAGIRDESHAIRHKGRTFYYGRADAVAAVDELLAAVDEVAGPGDRLFVGTGDLRKTPYSEAFLYYLLPELTPATRYIEMDPGVANAADSGMAAEIANSDIVILSSVRDDWVEPNDSREFGPDEPNQVVAREFCEVGSYGTGLFGRGLYELYRRCR